MAAAVSLQVYGNGNSTTMTTPPRFSETAAMTFARVLVVEDEVVVAMDLQATLTELGYDVVGVAESAAEAIFMAGRERPDLVLMDIKLRGVADGIHAASMLKSALPAPIVFLTANADDATFRRALATGAGGFLVKPFDARSLHHAIQVALSQSTHERRLKLENSLLKQDSVIDPLTGLFNRRYLESVLDRELEFAQRDAHRVGVIMLDLDHFKMVNDEFGHAAGDVVLRGVADVLRARLRIYDSACRYGGEELVIVVPGAGPAECQTLAEALRAQLAEATYSDAGRELPSVTASFGIAVYADNGRTTEDLLRAADAALYAAKEAGRNCVKLAQR